MTNNETLLAVAIKCMSLVCCLGCGSRGRWWPSAGKLKL